MRFTPDNNIVPCICFAFSLIKLLFNGNNTHTHRRTDTRKRFVGSSRRVLGGIEINKIKKNLISVATAKLNAVKGLKTNDDTNQKEGVDFYVIRKR